MSASAWIWLLTIVGTIASVAGVVFSCMAWVQAKGAKRAAEEARDVVKARETAHEFADLASDSKELLAAVRDGQSQRAAKAATDLVHDLSILKERRSSYLSKKSVHKINAIIDVLNLVCDALEEVGLPDDFRMSTIQRCRQIHQMICEIAGNIEKKAEEL
jgi:hypothetical protein